MFIMYIGYGMGAQFICKFLPQISVTAETFRFLLFGLVWFGLDFASKGAAINYNYLVVLYVKRCLSLVPLAPI